MQESVYPVQKKRRHSSGGRRTHGHSVHRAFTPEYGAWSNMIQRCTNPNNPEYHNYGERGITVCERWRLSFTAFWEDVGDRPSPQHSIHRINNDIGYEPGNVRWVTAREQGAGRRRNVWIEAGGERLILAEWSRRTGIPYDTIRGRLLRGWSPERAMGMEESNRG